MFLVGEASLQRMRDKRRHHKHTKILHWKPVKKYVFDVRDIFCKRVPGSVFENKDYKILWDFRIQTDYVLEAHRPDLVTVD